MLKYQVDRNVLINIYLSFIRPILEYGNVIWVTITLEIQTLMTVSINICHSVVHIPKINWGIDAGVPKGQCWAFPVPYIHKRYC
jgi:hypothetical protein